MNLFRCIGIIKKPKNFSEIGGMHIIYVIYNQYNAGVPVDRDEIIKALQGTFKMSLDNATRAVTPGYNPLRDTKLYHDTATDTIQIVLPFDFQNFKTIKYHLTWGIYFQRKYHAWWTKSKHLASTPMGQISIAVLLLTIYNTFN